MSLRDDIAGKYSVGCTLGDDVAGNVLATVRRHVEALPEQAATGSRDFGRGYALAIRDVLHLLEGSE